MPPIKRLSDTYPELAAQWHPTKNKELTPHDVGITDKRKVWWYLPYDDPETGKHYEFEWQQRIRNRTIDGCGCPYLSNSAVWPGFNDLATKHPNIAKEWHPTKNGSLKPSDVVNGAHIKVWWYLPYDDPKTGKHYDFEWQATVDQRVTQGTGCPYLSGQKVWPGFNDLKTCYPDLSEEWHPIKNGALLPENVTYGSNQKVWWYLPYDDPKTGRHYDFEWQATVYHRVNQGTGCPYLSGKKVWPGYNDLATCYPALTEEWDEERNQVDAGHVLCPSNKTYWWMVRYVTVNGEEKTYRFKASLHSRITAIANQGATILKNSLLKRYPELLSEWHPTKNGTKSPYNTYCYSEKTAWWYLPYNDPITGKHFDFEWCDRIVNRTKNGEGCPYLCGKAAWPGYNDLLTLYPVIAAQWHPIKNKEKVYQIVAESEKAAWWYLSYDDPVTGKHFDFEWCDKIVNRTKNGAGCPYLCGKKAWPGYNDLATLYPEIAAEWNYKRNNGLSPENVIYSSNMVVWWMLSYVDPKTGNEVVREWRAAVSARILNKKMSNKQKCYNDLMPGFNDLQTRYPAIAAQWHPSKNGNLHPACVIYNSKESVWWYLPYDDPDTGRHHEFEWKASIRARTSGCGCPYLTVNSVWKGFNDLESRVPELAKEFCLEKNGNLTPDKVYWKSKKAVWWSIDYTDPDTGDVHRLSWQATPYARAVSGRGCPYLYGMVLSGFNDLRTKFPNIALEWHPTKNGSLKPENIYSKSTKSVWWYFPYDDPKTGLHHDFEWEATVLSRTVVGNGCPYLTGHAVWPGYNDLATCFPVIAAQWHPTANNGLIPNQVTYSSHQYVWWYYPYDDPQTGKRFDFEWQATVNTRTNKGNGCPYLASSGGLVWPGFNDLQTRHPEIAKLWHPTKNGSLTPDMVMSMSGKMAWWYYPYDDPETGEHYEFEWTEIISNRVNLGPGCPYLSNAAVWAGFNDLATRYPKVAAQWHPTKNGNLKPTEIYAKSNRIVWWYLKYVDPETGEVYDFEWHATVKAQVESKGVCPYLSNAAVWAGFNDLATRYPEVAAQWHPTKNGNLKPTEIYAKSNRIVWWYLKYVDPETGEVHDFEWHATVKAQVESKGVCPYLSNAAVWAGYNDLASCYPEIAAEWNFEKNRTLMPDTVYKFSGKKVWWKCKHGHEWYASIDGRTKFGAGCPKCKKNSRGQYDD